MGRRDCRWGPCRTHLCVILGHRRVSGVTSRWAENVVTRGSPAGRAVRSARAEVMGQQPDTQRGAWGQGRLGLVSQQPAGQCGDSTQRPGRAEGGVSPVPSDIGEVGIAAEGRQVRSLRGDSRRQPGYLPLGTRGGVSET